MEFNSIPFINSVHDFFSTFSCFCSHPLFSTLVTLYTLILLYAPSFFLKVVLCPVLNSTGIILLFLLKLGANKRSSNDSCSQETRILDSSANERLETDPICVEPKVLDHKDKINEKVSNDGGKLPLDSSFELKSTSLEQRFLDLVDHNQANINFKAKVDLGFGSNHTDSVPKPNSCLDLESNQKNIEFEHDLGLESNSQDDYYKPDLQYTSCMESSQVVDKGETRMEMNSMHVDTTMKFLEWNMKAPLEIIYEAYDEEDEEEDNNETNMVPCDIPMWGCERYPSLSMYSSGSESDSSSDDNFLVNKHWEAHESVFFKWEAEEDEREELIEISLDRYDKRSNDFCQDEEDNLIEIDLFPQEVE
ncbi:hypothetical protein R6Q59_006020 [Mikania micrantha]|uniref:Uncharacterized protein n=1 Tax=Mikania micrantha TaxID=192012 RepID=A0A5N6PWF5_9ASTR|nr:hypothetical protein E3N88_04645 [Mikania micrantha]